MKFECNTKPLSDALSLGVIGSNISNYHKKSTLIQLTASRDELRLNIESAQIRTELTIKGNGDEDATSTVLVSSSALKQLIGTFDTPQTTIEFTDTGIILRTGKSKFNLPKLVDTDELELQRPDFPEVGSPEIEINGEDWKFIKDHQMYAIAMSFIHPVYTRVWVGSEGDVLVGDYDNSLFTHSNHSSLGNTCLLSDTIINLFNSLPDGSKLNQAGKDYIIQANSDSITYRTQFTPVYESDEGIGSYNSEIFLNMMALPEGGVEVDCAKISKFLNQADMLRSASQDTIHFSIDNNVLSITDANVDCKLDISNDENSKYDVEFKTELFKRVISNYGEGKVRIAPIVQEGEVSGVLVWDDSLTTVIAGVE